MSDSAESIVTSSAVESSAPETSQQLNQPESKQPVEKQQSKPSEKGFGTPDPKQSVGQTEAQKKEAADKKAEAVRKWKLKVDKGEEEYSEEDLIRLAQLGRASDKRFQEAAKLRKQAEDFISKLKTNPREVLENPAIGLNLKEFAENYLLEQIEKEELTPEQKRIRELEEKIARDEEEKKRIEAQKQEEEEAKLRAHYTEEYNRSFQEALAASGLPRTNRTIRSMAKYMHKAISEGIDRSPKDVVELVRQDYLRDIQELFGQSDGDSLLQILGDSIANKIRQADLARLRAGKFQKQPAPTPQPVSTQPETEKEPSKKYMNIHEWREYQAKRFKSGE